MLMLRLLLLLLLAENGHDSPGPFVVIAIGDDEIKVGGGGGGGGGDCAPFRRGEGNVTCGSKGMRKRIEETMQSRHGLDGLILDDDR